MGCYDTIYGKCPSCGREINTQSKSGDCDDWYPMNKVPINVSNDANRHAPFKCKCGEEWMFERDIGQHGNCAYMRLVKYEDLKNKNKSEIEELKQDIKLHKSLMVVLSKRVDELGIGEEVNKTLLKLCEELDISLWKGIEVGKLVKKEIEKQEKWDSVIKTMLKFRSVGIIYRDKKLNQVLIDYLGATIDPRVPVEIKIKDGEIRIKRIEDE